MIRELRSRFNQAYESSGYEAFLRELEQRAGTRVEFRVAETPVFLPREMLDEMAAAGAAMARKLIGWPEYLEAAAKAIPEGYRVAGKSAHPHFLTADFALVQVPAKKSAPSGFVPRLVEIQAFPSVYAYQATLNQTYADVFHLPASLGVYLGGLNEEGFWALLKKTVLGGHAAENVILTEVDPLHQKTLPDFLLTSEKLGIAVVDIATLVPIGKKLHYRNEAGELMPIHRIYNRAIADEMMARKIELPFRLTDDWDVEWAGHPNWYFLISKFSVPWLAQLRLLEGVSAEEGGAGSSDGALGAYVPPAVFLDDFLRVEGPEGGQTDGKTGGRTDGKTWLSASGVELPMGDGPEVVYDNLLLKPLFSFAGKGIQFAPSRGDLLAIPESERGNYLLQQRMHFVPTIETPHGLTQAEIRILYLWPDGGELTPVISLVRLGRGKMMGVDHNRNQEWVGGSAAFWR